MRRVWLPLTAILWLATLTALILSIRGTRALFIATHDVEMIVSIPSPTLTPTPTATPTPEPGGCQGLHGAIWTTDANGNRVNQNLYERKEDVYLNGGPDSPGNAGFPDGYYFYQVTTPRGDPLYAEPRVVEVVDGRFRYLVQLAPFDDSPNREYKVWLSATRDFPPHCSKTDNFRIKGKP